MKHVFPRRATVVARSASMSSIAPLMEQNAACCKMQRFSVLMRYAHQFRIAGSARFSRSRRPRRFPQGGRLAEPVAVRAVTAHSGARSRGRRAAARKNDTARFADDGRALV